MRVYPSVALALLLALPGATFAADATGNYAVWGVGHASCNQFVNAYDKDAAQDYKSFLAGYLTAFNTVTDGVYQATGQNTVTDNLKALRAHCDTHRMDSFELAIRSLLQESARAEEQQAHERSQRWGRPAPAPDSGS